MTGIQLNRVEREGYAALSNNAANPYPEGSNEHEYWEQGNRLARFDKNTPALIPLPVLDQSAAELQRLFQRAEEIGNKYQMIEDATWSVGDMALVLDGVYAGCACRVEDVEQTDDMGVRLLLHFGWVSICEVEKA